MAFIKSFVATNITNHNNHNLSRNSLYHGGEIMNQEIRTQVVIKVANLDPKVQRLLKAYEEFKAAASDLQVETWKECIEVHVE